MDEQRAREILCRIVEGDIVLEDDLIPSHILIDSVSWKVGDERAQMNGQFTADQLEAIAWWMRNKRPISENPPKWPERKCCGCGVIFSCIPVPGPSPFPPFSCGKPECDKARDNHPINNMVA